MLDYRELAQQVELKTGGMSASPHVLADDSHLDTYEQVALVTGARRSSLGAVLSFPASSEFTPPLSPGLGCAFLIFLPR